MRKLYISSFFIGLLASLANSNIIYGKPGAFLQPTQPSSSVASPTLQSNKNDELLKEAESVYGPYGGHHGYGVGAASHHHHGLQGGHGGGGGDLAVVVTGGYKVAENPPHYAHSHGHATGIHQGIDHGAINHGHQDHHVPIGHGVPLEHGGPIAHGHGGLSLGHSPHGVLPHQGHIGHLHGRQEHLGHGLGGVGPSGTYGHPGIYPKVNPGYGHHVPSHGLIGHHRLHGGHGGYHHHLGHPQTGFKPIIGHGYNAGHHHGQGHAHAHGQLFHGYSGHHGLHHGYHHPHNHGHVLGGHGHSLGHGHGLHHHHHQGVGGINHNHNHGHHGVLGHSDYIG